MFIIIILIDITIIETLPFIFYLKVLESLDSFCLLKFIIEIYLNYLTYSHCHHCSMAVRGVHLGKSFMLKESYNTYF